MSVDPDVRPIAFISHAGEDRERFVEAFAARLINNGVECWASFWDILPGDDVIQAIFEKGISVSKSFIVVLSSNSVSKPWVREELSAAMVRKIEGKMKIIPVRLDACVVPESLKHLHWQDVHDVSSYDSEFQRILNGVFGMVDKPKPGDRPEYTKPPVLLIGDLTPLDSLIFEAGCRIALESDCPLVNEETLLKALDGRGIREEQVIESQEILDGRGYIELLRTMGPPHIEAFAVTLLGFDRFVHAAVADWNSLMGDVAAILCRDQSGNHGFIADELRRPRFLIEHAFRVLENNGMIKFAESKGGGIHLDAYWVSPELKRKLEA